jgi:hypothetical protein
MSFFNTSKNNYNSVEYDPKEYELEYSLKCIKKGTSVRLSYPFKGTNPIDRKNIRKLELNKDYIVQDVHINSNEILIWLENFPTQYFNGIHFTLSHRNKIIPKWSFVSAKFSILKKKDKLLGCWRR